MQKEAAALEISKGGGFSIYPWYNDPTALPNRSIRRIVMQKDTIKVDVNSIPPYIRDDLAMATLEFIKWILAQPNGREMLNAKLAEHEKKEGRGGQHS